MRRWEKKSKIQKYQSFILGQKILYEIKYLLNVKPYSEGVDGYENVYDCCLLPPSTDHWAALPDSLVPVVVVAHTLHLHHGAILLHQNILLVNIPPTSSYSAHREQLKQGWQEHNDFLGLYLGVLTTCLKGIHVFIFFSVIQ